MPQREEVNPRLAVVIPAWNESAHVASVIRGIPRNFLGVSDVGIIVVDDGSTDDTPEVAASAGADRVILLPKHRGLARAWSTGIAAALRDGAQIIVHTDADGQYLSEDIVRLLGPLLSGDADMTVGARPVGAISHFSWLKRVLQRLGSRAVSLAAGVSVPDAPSGFRAMTAQAARSLNVHGGYTYTLETLIQAGRMGLSIVSVPVRATGPTRPSRLVRSIPQYVWRSVVTIVRVAVLYRPFRFFIFTGGVLLSAATGAAVLAFATEPANSEVPLGGYLFAAGALAIVGVQAIFTAFLADALAANRKLTEELLRRSSPEVLP